jgi:hypothetical protein
MDLMDKQELEIKQRADNPRVATVRADQLMGPWIVATIQGVSMPFTVDTFCPKNLISCPSSLEERLNQPWEISWGWEEPL